jgi:ketol-acid reductoisomerase
MPNRYYEKDGNLDYLAGRTVAIIGYGSQGHAHALNLRDSGVDVVVGLPAGSKSVAKAEAAGLKVLSPADAAKAANVVMILVPDHIQADLYNNNDRPPHDRRQDSCSPTASTSTSAPSCPRPISMSPWSHPKLPATASANSTPKASASPPSSPYTRTLLEKHLNAPSPMRSRSAASRPASSTPTSAKKPRATSSANRPSSAAARPNSSAPDSRPWSKPVAPEIAYFECLHELKLIVDLIQEGGLSYMRYSVSDTAEYGDYTRGPRIVNDQTRVEMKKILAEIQSGDFAKQWIAENKAGRHKFLAMREAAQTDQIETVGKSLRDMMPFLKKKKEVGVPVA